MKRAALLLLAACSGTGEPPPPPTFDPCIGLPGVTLTASATKVRVRAPVELSAAGGEGHFVYSLKAGSMSGGEVLGSRFLAGSTAGTDTVVATDACGQIAELAIEVIAAFDVAPARATVKPGTAFDLLTSGILGTAMFSVTQAGSGGTVAASGRYTAGNRDGVDWVSVRDSATADEALVRIDVSAAARFRVDPERLALPAGGSVTLRSVDGSNRIAWRTVSGPGTVTAAGVLTLPADAGTLGPTEVEAKDAFTGLTAGVTVRALTELGHATRPHGRLVDRSPIATGDFDGDGLADVAVGVPDSDLGALGGGAVFVYLATAQGLPAEPSWTLTGKWEGGLFGGTLAAGDLDGDGRADLAIGAPSADVAADASGAVSLYKFLADGPRALRAPLTGFRDARFGSAVAIADADGDGDSDLFVGALGADLVNSMTQKARGVVDVFLMQAGVPIADVGAMRISGQDLAADGSLLQTSSNLNAGFAIAAADFNGDGKVDLAIGVRVNNSLLGGTPRMAAQIAVQVHLGRGGPMAYVAPPDAVLFPAAANDAVPAFGVLLVAAPKLGSEPPMLVATLDLADAPAQPEAGGAVAFELTGVSPLAAGANPVQLGVAEAHARWYGVSFVGLAGRAVAFADVDGQPGVELLLGSPGSEGGPSHAGKVLAYPFATATRGTVYDQPLQARVGAMSDALGAGLEVSGGKLLVVGGRTTTPKGDFTGRLEVLAPGGSGLAGWTASSAHDFPAVPAGELFGSAVEAVRVGSTLKLAVGAPGASGPGANNDGEDVGTGEVRLFDAAMPGTSVVAARGGVTPKSRGGKSVGTSIAFTDFDGDGRLDLAVGEPQFTVPAAAERMEIDPIYVMEHPGCIAAAEQNTGAVMVLRGNADGTFTRMWRLWAPGAGLGQGLAGGFDYDGDGKQDVAALRNGAVEVFLGRAAEDATGAKLTMGCDRAHSSLPQLLAGPVIALGDVDGDGCGDVAYRWVGLSNGFTGGVKILFGFGAAACGATQRVLAVSGGPEGGLTFVNLGTSMAPVGRLFGGTARHIAMAGGVRVNGEATTALFFYDTAQLAAAKPVTGERIVPAYGGTVLTPARLLPQGKTWEWAASIAGGADVTGDGADDLVVTATGETPYSPAGTVYVFAGGAPWAIAPAPYAVLIGDSRELGAFGRDVALTPGQLLVGAPASSRTGTKNGTAFTLSLP